MSVDSLNCDQPYSVALALQKGAEAYGWGRWSASNAFKASQSQLGRLFAGWRTRNRRKCGVYSTGNGRWANLGAGALQVMILTTFLTVIASPSTTWIGLKLPEQATDLPFFAIEL